MFTPNKIRLTDENISYFSNINHLAKDIKKFFVFLANRERYIFKQLKNIKHNQLLHYISKSYGFNSYKDFNINKTSTDFLNLEKLKYEVSQGIKKTTGIKDELIEEVFDLFFLDVLSPRKDTLKSSVMKKIKNRLQKLKDFEKLDIYSDSRRRNKKEKLLVESFKKIYQKKNMKILFI